MPNHFSFDIIINSNSKNFKNITLYFKIAFFLVNKQKMSAKKIKGSDELLKGEKSHNKNQINEQESNDDFDGEQPWMKKIEEVSYFLGLFKHID